MLMEHGLTRYHGLERRKGPERRSGGTRREEIRFEPTKDDRRCGADRRKKSASAWEHMRIR